MIIMEKGLMKTIEDHQKAYPRGYNHGQEQKTYGERPGNY